MRPHRELAYHSANLGLGAVAQENTAGNRVSVGVLKRGVSHEHDRPFATYSLADPQVLRDVRDLLPERGRPTVLAGVRVPLSPTAGAPYLGHAAPGSLRGGRAARPGPARPAAVLDLPPVLYLSRLQAPVLRRDEGAQRPEYFDRGVKHGNLPNLWENTSVFLERLDERPAERAAQL